MLQCYNTNLLVPKLVPGYSGGNVENFALNNFGFETCGAQATFGYHYRYIIAAQRSPRRVYVWERKLLEGHFYVSATICPETNIAHYDFPSKNLAAT